MSLFGYLLVAVAKILGLLINLYTLVVAVSVLLSWVHPDPYNPLVRIIRQLTEPVFQWIRRFLPQRIFRIGIDFTPLIVLILLALIDNVLVNLLYDFGSRWLAQ